MLMKVVGTFPVSWVHFAYYTQGPAAAHKHAKYKKCKYYSVK